MALDQPTFENPYIGPRTYRTEEAHLFFGRDREARDLISLIVSERLVLFYAQSGAGKSSLLNTKLLPGLSAEGFEVLPVGRVSGQSGLDLQTDDIFVYNLLLSLHQDPDLPVNIESMTLHHFLDNLVRIDGKFQYNDQYQFTSHEELKPRVLMIDQFEEILTTNIPLWQHRARFFEQLNQALKIDQQLWVVLTIREDFVAGLDPYLHYMPGNLRNHFYMRRLSREEALEAITQPAKIGGRNFTPEAADILVDNLRQYRLQERQDEIHLSEFVEPVQLQAVCFQMWAKLKERPGMQITEQDVRELADVDTALAQFYEDTITDTVAETGVSEIYLRDWFERQLITEAGTRSIVYRGDEDTGGLPTKVADFVSTKFMLRPEVRAGGTWYELIHDRFVQPILESNNEWRADQPLIIFAREWKETNYSEEKLLDGRQLTRFLETNWQALGSLVAEFIEASQKAQREQEVANEAVRQRRRRFAILASSLVGVVIIGLLLFTLIQANRNSNEQAYLAEQALAAEATAGAEAERAFEAEATARADAEKALQAFQEKEQQQNIAFSGQLAAQAMVELGNANYEVAALLAIEAGRVSDTAEAYAAIRQTIGGAGGTDIILAGHEGEINQAAWSPDGSRIVTASSDGTARVWDAESGQELLVLDTVGVFQTAWSPEGSRIVTASSDGSVRIWDVGRGVVLHVLKGHTSTVYQAAWSPDANMLVTASSDGTARIWDVKGDVELYELAGHTGEVFHAAWSPDGNRIMTVADDGTARIWDAESGVELQILEGIKTVVNHAAWSPDGSKIVTASDDGITRIWDVYSGQELYELIGHTDVIFYAAWSPDSSRILTTSGDGTARIWDVESSEQLVLLSGHTASVWQGQWSPDGEGVLTASRDGTARIWSLRETNLIGTELPSLIGHQDKLNQVHWSSDGSRALTASSDGTARVWDTASGDILLVLSQEAGINVARWNNDESLILTAGNDTTARIWDAETGELLTILEGHTAAINQAIWNDDVSQTRSVSNNVIRVAAELPWRAEPLPPEITSKTLIITSSNDTTARIWDADSGETVAVLEGHAGPVLQSHWSPDGSQVATASADGTARIWNATSGELLNTLEGHTGLVYQANWNPGGDFLVTASQDGTARIWDLNGKLPAVKSILPHNDAVLRANWNSDGSIILTASRDGTARIWDANTGKEMIVFTGHTGTIFWSTWNQDESMVLTSSADQTARIWDASTGELLAIMPGHQGGVVQATWSSDEGRVLTASSDSLSRQFFTEMADLLEAACQKVSRNMTQEEWQRFMGSLPYEITCPNLP